MVIFHSAPVPNVHANRCLERAVVRARLDIMSSREHLDTSRALLRPDDLENLERLSEKCTANLVTSCLKWLAAIDARLEQDSRFA